MVDQSPRPMLRRPRLPRPTSLRRIRRGGLLLTAFGTALLCAACTAGGLFDADSPAADKGPLAVPRSLGTPTPSNGAMRERAPEAAPVLHYGAIAPAPGGNGGGPVRPPAVDAQGGITLDYVDADIRELTRIILGDLLKVNYTIDPAVKGTATIHTVNPVRRDDLVPTLQSLLGQNGAALVEEQGLYRVVPAAGIAASGALVEPGAPEAGSEVVGLRYVGAQALAQALEPFIAPGARVAPAPSGNQLVVTGTPSARQTLIRLIRTFDVDALAGQSFGLFPIHQAGPAKVAASLQQMFQTGKDAPGSLVRVTPLPEANAVLVVTAQPRYLERARNFVALLDHVEDDNGRTLYVYYLQNAQAIDVAPLLTKVLSSGRGGNGGGAGSTAPGSEAVTLSNSPTSQAGAASGQNLGYGASPSASPTGTTGGTTGTTGGMTGAGGSNQTLAATLGNGGGAGIGGSGSGSGSDSDTGDDSGGDSGRSGGEGPRIVADPQRNAILVMGTPDEYALVEGALRKLDQTPSQVLIEATIAEVTLNDTLQYGLQYYLRANPMTQATLSAVTAGTVASSFPGFNLFGTSGPAQYVISALRSVTKVKVVSAPTVLCLDNEKAYLQVGNVVPIITQSATSTLTSTPAIVNSVDYRQTGVILQVRPRISNGDLVTLDIEQDVSDVVNTTTSQIDSPTFDQRTIKSRVVVADGETVGLGGLIRDTRSLGNQGIPYLKDIPVLGFLFGTENDTGERNELLVMITPHVVRDQRNARSLTDALRSKLAAPAGLVPPPLTGHAPL